MDAACVVSDVGVAQGETAVFEHADAAPFRIDGFEISVEQVSRGGAAFFGDDTWVRIDKERFARLGFFDDSGDGR